MRPDLPVPTIEICAIARTIPPQTPPDDLHHTLARIHRHFGTH